MGTRFLRMAGWAALFLAMGPALVWADAATEKLPLPGDAVLDARAMSARIDELLAARWAEKGVTPAPRADDPEFFRRLSLDLNGSIPTIIDLKDFIDIPDPDKRRNYVAKLLSSDPNEDTLYINHFTTFWRVLLFSQSTNQQAQFIGIQLEPWLRNHVKKNTPYDKMVRELLTTPPGQSFYQVNESKPEVIAASAARLFLGVKLECAQCHNDRSGGSWKQTQFWEFAAFFTSVGPAGRPVPRQSGPAKIKIPEKDQTVQARFLDGREPDWKANPTAHATLAEWLTAPDNPYFARAIVNRMWYYFLGTGLTDPVDAISEENPPSHPELLDELAQQLVAHNFDLKYLIRAITGSRAYQLTSAKTHDSQDDPRLFARMAVRGMSPEQLFDSLAVATAYREAVPAPGNRAAFFGNNTPRSEFLAKFTNSHDKRTETETSILQALFLMNGKLMADVTGVAKNRSAGLPGIKTIQTVADNASGARAKELEGKIEKLGKEKAAAVAAEDYEKAITLRDQLKDVKKKREAITRKNIAELYLVTLSRKPTPKELDRFVRHVESGGDRVDALVDVFWVLLNSSEFMSNH